MDNQLRDKLQKILLRYQELEKQLQDFSVAVEQKARNQMAKEYSDLSRLVELYKQYQVEEANLSHYKDMIDEAKDDKELAELSKEEVKHITQKLAGLHEQIKAKLSPKNTADDRDVIMEIRPAAGGDEAALFCEDLFSMYSRFIDRKGWKLELLSSSAGNVDGFKELIFSVSGKNVYAHLKYESGVHRVQRVPKTETQGRVHTSTVTVVVMPAADQKDITIKHDDVRVDTFRAGGAGGQHVNKTDSAIRITHLPSNLVVQCQDEKSQHANKEKAFKVLYARLYDLEMKKQKEKESLERLAQIGGGKRSEKIRTYNFPQSRITDHRCKVTFHQLSQIIKGELDPVIEALKISEES